MKQSFKFKAHHIPTDKDYWFDLIWGSMPDYYGYIGMLPIEQLERKGICIYDDRIPIDPDECEITIFKEHEKDQLEFEKAVRPLIKYLAENHHPHCSVIVDSTHAELLEGIQSFKTDEYIID